MGEQSSALIKIEYFDKVLNLEKKIFTLIRKINKIKLRVVHKPFVMLDVLRFLPKKSSPLETLDATFAELRRRRKSSAWKACLDRSRRVKAVIGNWARLVSKLQKFGRQKLVKKIETSVQQKTQKRRKLQILKRSSKFLGSVMNRIIKEAKAKHFRDLTLRMVMLGPRAARKDSRVKGGDSKLFRKTIRDSLHLDADPSPAKPKMSPDLSRNLLSNQKQGKPQVSKDSPTTTTRVESSGRSPHFLRNVSFGKRNEGMNILLGQGGSGQHVLTTGRDPKGRSANGPSIESEKNNQFIFEVGKGHDSPNSPLLNEQIQFNKNDFSSNSDNKEDARRSFQEDQDIIELFHLRKTLKAKRNPPETSRFDYLKKSHSNLHSNEISVELFNFISVLSFKVRRKQRLFLEKAFDSMFHHVIQDEYLQTLHEMANIIRKFFLFEDLNKLGACVSRRARVRDHSVYTLSRTFLKKKKECFRRIMNVDSETCFDEDDIRLSQANSFIGRTCSVPSR